MKLHEAIARRLFAVLGLALIAPAARAQFTNNFQTNTISAVTSNWIGNGTYVVGSNTFLDTLVIQNGGVLSNGTGYIGYKTSGSNNTAIIRDAGSVWTNSLDLYVGYKGAGNQLAISNGGSVFNTNAIVGMFTSASNNLVTVSGTGSVWNLSGFLTLGSNSVGNQLIITNGGQVVDGGANIGLMLGGSDRENVLVTGPNSVWSNSSTVVLNNNSPGTILTVSGGGGFFVGGGLVIGSSAGSYGNIVLVTDPGSTCSVGGELQVSGFGSGSSGHQFIVSNGASAFIVDAFVSPDANMLSNAVVVTGPGSVLTAGNSIFVSGADGSLIVANGGVVQTPIEVIADFTGSEGALIVAGGTNYVSSLLEVGWNGGTGTVNIASGALFVTNATGSANTTINGIGSTLILGAGVFKTDNLVVTNGGAIQYNLAYQVDNGTVTVAGGSLQAGSNLVIAATANSTGIVLVVGGTLVATNGTLSVGNDGTITSGGGVGLLTVSNGTLLASTILLGSSAGGRGDLTLADGGTISCPTGTNCLFVINSLGADQIGGDLAWYGSTLQCGVTAAGDYNVSGGQAEFEDLYVGYSDTGTMTIAGGVANISSRLIVGYLGSPAVANGTVWITGGQVTVNSASTIGNDGVGQMIISNGAVMTATSVIVGNGSNHGTLTMPGGTLNVYDTLTVGDCGAGHVGAVTIAGGNLFVTNAAHNATLNVRNGTLTLTSGQLKVDRFVMTDSCASFVRNGGTLLYNQAVLDPARDDDGDGIPNGYEQAHGLDPLNAADANLDSDGDGFSNRQEYLAGTDPNDPKSTPLRITAIARESNNIRVTWSTFAGTTNALQATGGGVGGNYSAAGFADIFTVNPVVGNTTNYLDVGAATNVPARYYRIRLVP